MLDLKVPTIKLVKLSIQEVYLFYLVLIFIVKAEALEDQFKGKT